MRSKALILSLLFSGSVYAQEMRKATYVTAYDLDATSYTFCVTTGQNGGAYDPDIPGNGRVETSGSSATITGVTGSADSFGPPAIGDVLYLKLANGTTAIRYILTNADADTVTVTSVIDLTGGVAFSWRKVSCGTAATDGWIDVAGFAGKKITFEITQSVVTGGIDFKFECRDNTHVSTANQVYPGESSDCGTMASLTGGVCQALTTVTGAVSLVFSPEEQWDACRVGMKINSADDGNDLTTNLEVINITLVVWNAK